MPPDAMRSLLGDDPYVASSLAKAVKIMQKRGYSKAEPLKVAMP